jgi:hypothetical protein
VRGAPPDEDEARARASREAARGPATQEEGTGAHAERRGPRQDRSREPLTRQEAETLLDAFRAREKPMPLFGTEKDRKQRRPDAAKDW